MDYFDCQLDICQWWVCLRRRDISMDPSNLLLTMCQSLLDHNYHCQTSSQRLCLTCGSEELEPRLAYLKFSYGPILVVRRLRLENHPKTSKNAETWELGNLCPFSQRKLHQSTCYSRKKPSETKKDQQNPSLSESTINSILPVCKEHYLGWKFPGSKFPGTQKRPDTVGNLETFCTNCWWASDDGHFAELGLAETSQREELHRLQLERIKW